MNKTKLLKMALIGAGVLLASFCLAWQGDTTAIAALKVALGMFGTWLYGNLARTGEVLPRADDMKQVFTKPPVSP